ncbi:MAG TPA: cytochrome c oxidase subunit 4 [Candidatus Eremiobacteraceae bacterium]|nr:cytochrome c oxidase subunit 4 [Candidatus Eremiobacteraceae bacterium]
MKSGIVLFISSAIFGILIAGIYWLSSRDPTGTVLLGIMAAALIFGACYMLLAERHADLSGDRPDAVPGDERGVRIGIFTTRSPWTIVCAAGGALIVWGLAISWTLTAAGFAVLAYAVARLIIESR